MKVIWITLTVGLLAITAVLAQDNEEYDYEEDVPVAPQPVQRGRSPLLSSRQSKAIPLTSNNKIKTANGKTTVGSKQTAAAKAPPPPVQEEQDEYQDEYDQPGEEPVEVTSTEAPKKTIKPIVRPFRSNDDLLAALKRRRQQVQNTGAIVDKSTTTTTTTTSAPVNSHKKGSNTFSSGRRGRVSASRGQATQATETVAAEVVEPTKKSPQSRRYNSRSNSARAQPQPVEEEKPLEELPQQPVAKPKFGRGSRRPTA